MKILVTGAAGFIGFHLSQRLINDGHQVVGIDNINEYYSIQLKYDRLKELGINHGELTFNVKYSSTHPHFTFYRINIENTGALEMLFGIEQFDIVYHLAAQAGVRYSIENPRAYTSSNIVGFENIIEASKLFQIQHLIYASSSSVYGNSNKFPLSIDENVDKPVSLYAATKKSNELVAHTYSHLYNLNTTGLRFFTVYGPWGRPDMAPILFAKAITQDQPIKVFNNGKLARDFTYIDDIIEGLIRLMPNPEKVYNLYNIGKGNPVELLDFIEQLELNLGKKAIKNFMPMQPGDVYKTWADIEPLKKVTDFKPQIEIQEGIKKFSAWFKTYFTNNNE